MQLTALKVASESPDPMKLIKATVPTARGRTFSSGFERLE